MWRLLSKTLLKLPLTPVALLHRPPTLRTCTLILDPNFLHFPTSFCSCATSPPLVCRPLPGAVSVRVTCRTRGEQKTPAEVLVALDAVVFTVGIHCVVRTTLYHKAEVSALWRHLSYPPSWLHPAAVPLISSWTCRRHDDPPISGPKNWRNCMGSGLRQGSVRGEVCW